MSSSIKELKNIYSNNFIDCKSDFHSCSFDPTNNIYLVSSTKKCFNYDDIKEIVFFGRKTVCSVDSIAFDEIEDAIIFVEFKDSKYSSCRDNFITSSQDSFLINRLIISLLGDESMNFIKRKCILVLDEQKNSTFISSYKRSKISKKLEDNIAYKVLKEKLLDKEIFGIKLFDDVAICTQHEFDNVVKNI